MPTEKPRVTFTISQDKLDVVDSYRFNHKFKNQTQAILSLIEKGLSNFEQKTAPSLSDEAMKLAADYDELDGHGKRVVRLVADEEKARCTADQSPRTAALREQREQMEAAEEITPEVIFMLPGFLSPVSAGTGQAAGDDYAEDFRLKKEPPRGASYIARVSGDSMEPTYHDGDLLFVRATVEIRPGQTGVFFMDGKAWVKELGHGELISHNPDPQYAPRPMTEDIRCQGLVLGVCDDSYFE